MMLTTPKIKQFLQTHPTAEIRFKGGCFPACAKVLMGNWTEKCIKDVRVGEEVIAVDEDGRLVKAKVTEKFVHLPEEYDNSLLEIKTKSKRVIITDNHWVFFDLEKQGKVKFYTEIDVIAKQQLDIFVLNKGLETEKVEFYKYLYDEKPIVYNLEIEKYHNFIVNRIVVHNKGKGKGGKTEVTYHDIVSIGEVQIMEDPTIIFEARLGNCLLIGDGETREVYLPNFWKKKFTFSRGWGYVKLYPETIKLYKNSLQNQLREGVDYTYDKMIGKVVFAEPPAEGDIICFTATYDPEYPNNTTFYADFSWVEILKRIGLRYYKYEDDSIDTYLKACVVAKNLIEEVWKPIMTGRMNIVYNPFVEIGHSIYVKNEKVGFDNAVFVKGVSKTISKDSISTDIDVYVYPETYGEKEVDESKDIFKFVLPEIWVSFLETDSLNYYTGDGCYLKGKIYDAYNQIKYFYTDEIKLRLRMADRVIEYPVNVNDIDKWKMQVKEGKFHQFYSCNFKSSQWTEAEKAIYFPEWYDTENPKLFVRKDMQVEIYNASIGEGIVSGAMVFLAKEPMFKGYFAPLFPYPPFVTYYRNGDHVILVDKNKDVWLIDMFFNSKKLTNFDFLNQDSVCIASNGKEKIYILDNQAKNLKIYNMEEDEIEKDIFINDCICGSLITNPFTLVTSFSGNPIIYARANSYKYDFPSLQYLSYFNFLEITAENKVIKYKVTFNCGDQYVLSGYPFIFRSKLYFGPYGFDLRKITEEYVNYGDTDGDYPQSWGNITVITENEDVKLIEIQVDDISTCPYIADKIDDVLSANGFNPNFSKTVYVVKEDKSKLYCFAVDCSEMTTEDLMRPFLNGSKIILLSRDGDTWNKRLVLESSDLTDKDSFIWYPIYGYSYNKIVGLLTGNEIKRKIDPDLNWSISVLNIETKELRAVLGKYFGSELQPYSQTAMNLVHAVWFKDKVLINWKYIEEYLEENYNDAIGILQGV